MNLMQHAPTLREMIAQRDALDAQINEMRAELRGAALEQARALVAEFDFTAYELGLVKTQQLKRGPDGRPTFPAKSARRPVEPIYRDPATGKTWSGRGKQPRWLDGHDRDEFLIERAAHEHSA